MSEGRAKDGRRSSEPCARHSAGEVVYRFGACEALAQEIAGAPPSILCIRCIVGDRRLLKQQTTVEHRALIVEMLRNDEAGHGITIGVLTSSA